MLQKYRITLEVTINPHATNVPESWNWHQVCDMRSDESIEVVTSESIGEVQPDPEQADADA